MLRERIQKIKKEGKGTDWDKLLDRSEKFNLTYENGDPFSFVPLVSIPEFPYFRARQQQRPPESGSIGAVLNYAYHGDKAIPIYGKFTGPRFSANRILRSGEKLTKQDINVNSYDAFDQVSKIHDIEFSLASSIADENLRNEYYSLSDEIYIKKVLQLEGKDKIPKDLDELFSDPKVIADSIYQISRILSSSIGLYYAYKDFEYIVNYINKKKDFDSTQTEVDELRKELISVAEGGERKQNFNNRFENLYNEVLDLKEDIISRDERLDFTIKENERFKKNINELLDANEITKYWHDYETRSSSFEPIENTDTKLRNLINFYSDRRFETSIEMWKESLQLVKDRRALNNYLSNIGSLNEEERVNLKKFQISNAPHYALTLGAGEVLITKILKSLGIEGSTAKGLALYLFNQRLERKDTSFYTELPHTDEEVSYLLDKIIEEGEDLDIDFSKKFLEQNKNRNLDTSTYKYLGEVYNDLNTVKIQKEIIPTTSGIEQIQNFKTSLGDLETHVVNKGEVEKYFSNIEVGTTTPVNKVENSSTTQLNKMYPPPSKNIDPNTKIEGSDSNLGSADLSISSSSEGDGELSLEELYYYILLLL